jgi:hypothetical protein
LGTAAVLHKSRLISRQIAAEFGAFSIRTLKKNGNHARAELSERWHLAVPPKEESSSFCLLLATQLESGHGAEKG